MGSVEMKIFSLGMFDYKTKFFKKVSENIVATIETTNWNVNQIALRDKKTVIYKRNEWGKNF